MQQQQQQQQTPPGSLQVEEMGGEGMTDAGRGSFGWDQVIFSAHTCVPPLTATGPGCGACGQYGLPDDDGPPAAVLAEPAHHHQQYHRHVRADGEYTTGAGRQMWSLGRVSFAFPLCEGMNGLNVGA